MSKRKEAPADVRAAFARRVLNARIKKGWNQSELARQAALHMPDGRFGRDSISKYEKATHLPYPVQLDALAKALGIPPARDWTEIKLQINKPADIDDGQPHADRVTGQRALHFCRSHLRVKRGKLEYVRSHWRGDASLGIRRSTYKVAA